MTFQCPATDYAQSLIIMHNYLMTFLFGIGTFVAFLMAYLVYKCMYVSSDKQYQTKNYSYNALYNYSYNAWTSYLYNANNVKNMLGWNNIINHKINSNLNIENKHYSLWIILNILFGWNKVGAYINLVDFIFNFSKINTSFFFKKINNVINFFEKGINQKYYNRLNNDFVETFFVYNNYYKQKYYALSKNNNWIKDVSNKLALTEGALIVNGLIVEPVLNNNLNSFLSWENVRHSTKLEIIWTLIPTFILFFVAVPSFSLLYGYDEPMDMPVITLKVIGHQWYWSYEYSDYSRSLQLGKSISFDSYMIHEDDFNSNLDYRLLETDTRVVLPVGATIRVLITSGDVLHSWAVPSLGTKTDAIPGRLNQALLLITRPGTFFGQCSELCGVNHGFMPIVIEGVKLTDYFTFLSLFYTE